MCHSVSFRPSALAASAAAALMMAGVASVGAQAPTAADPQLRFEVASVKPGVGPAEMLRLVGGPGSGGAFPFIGTRVQPGGRFQAVGATLQSLIMRAYGVRTFQLEGGPSWLTTDFFDVNAKADRENPTDAEINEMLKSLLAERFGLRVHTETRPGATNTLTLARSDGRLGSGLKKTSPECEKEIEERKRNPSTGAPSLPRPPAGNFMSMTTPLCGMTMTMMSSSARLMMGGQPFSRFADYISNEVNSLVVDNTGLTGLYDIVLEYESTRRLNLPPGFRPPGLDPNSTDSPGPPLPAALQQQLGIKLEKTTGPLPITIVDAAEHPSAD